jgi:hypothetical protein
MTATHTDILEFTAPIKIYVFKQDQEVSVSFLVSPHCVITRWTSLADFKYICDNWRTGVEGLETNMGRIWWSHRDVGPRPECQPADFVAISFGDWNFRIGTEFMKSLEQEFYRQLNSQNHWD